VNGKPIYYYKNNHEGTIVPSDAAQVILANCSNFIIQNLEITNMERGIQLGFSSYNTVLLNTITNNSDDGIYLEGSSNNKITENDFANNGVGIDVSWSESNHIFRNNITNNT